MIPPPPPVSQSQASLIGIPWDPRRDGIFARLTLDDIKRLRVVCQQFRREIDAAYQMLSRMGVYPLNRAAQIRWVQNHEVRNQHLIARPYCQALITHQPLQGENRNWVREHNARNQMIGRMKDGDLTPEKPSLFQSDEFRRECLLTASPDGYYAVVEDYRCKRVYGTRSGEWVGIATLSEDPLEEKPVWKFFSGTHLVQKITRKKIEFCDLLQDKTLFSLSTDISFDDDSTQFKQGLFLIESETNLGWRGIDYRTDYTCWNPISNKTFKLPNCKKVLDFITYDGTTHFLMYQPDKGTAMSEATEECTVLLTYHWASGKVEKKKLEGAPHQFLTHNRLLYKSDNAFQVMDRECKIVFEGEISTSKLHPRLVSTDPGIRFRVVARATLYSDRYQLLFVSGKSGINCYDVNNGKLVKTIEIPDDHRYFEMRLWGFQFAVFYHEQDDYLSVKCVVWNLSKPSLDLKKMVGTDIRFLVDAHHDQGILVSVCDLGSVHAELYDLSNMSNIREIELQNVHDLIRDPQELKERHVYFVNGLLVDNICAEDDLGLREIGERRKTLTVTNIYNFTGRKFTVGNLDTKSGCVIS